MKVDFHIHTNFSDGGLDLQSIFDKLNEQNVKIASITDHNNIDAYKHLNKINTHNIKIVKGIEIDVEFESNIYHILMYNFNENNPDFISYLNNSHNFDIIQFNQMISDLTQLYNLNFNQTDIDNFIKQNQYFDKVRLNNFLVKTKISKSPNEAFCNYTKNISEKKKTCDIFKRFF